MEHTRKKTQEGQQSRPCSLAIFKTETERLRLTRRKVNEVALLVKVFPSMLGRVRLQHTL